VRAGFLDGADHAELPFSEVVTALQPDRDLSRNPLFQAMCSYEPIAARPAPPRLRAEPERVPPPFSFVDVSLHISEQDDHVATSLCYDADLFDARTVARMSHELIDLLGFAAEQPDCAISVMPAGGRATAAAHAAVAPPASAGSPGSPDAAPSPALAALWAETLGVNDPDADFFKSGGTSLKAIHFVSKIQDAGLPPVTVRDVFESLTLRALASRMAERAAAAPERITRHPRHRRALVMPKATGDMADRSSMGDDDG
jgi:hypothetical protein